MGHERLDDRFFYAPDYEGDAVLVARDDCSVFGINACVLRRT